MEANGPINVEDEMRSLVSSAMEGVGYKQPEVRKRRSSNDAATSASSGAGPSASAATASGASASSGADGADTSSGDVQQFGNMQVIT